MFFLFNGSLEFFFLCVFVVFFGFCFCLFCFFVLCTVLLKCVFMFFLLNDFQCF